MLLAPGDRRLELRLGEALLDRRRGSCPTTSRRLPRAALASPWRARGSASGGGAGSRAPAARGRARSARGGSRSARRSRASRARRGGACAGGTASSVRMLCSRSASLIRMTRTSRAIASSILRKFSACASCCDWNSIGRAWRRRRRGRRPACRSASRSRPSVTSVSSITSCSSAAISACASRCQSARISATASGCEMYGSPDLRSWPCVGRVAEVVGLLEAGEVRGLEIRGDALPEAFQRGDCAQAASPNRRDV